MKYYKRSTSDIKWSRLSAHLLVLINESFIYTVLFKVWINTHEIRDTASGSYGVVIVLSVKSNRIPPQIRDLGQWQATTVGMKLHLVCNGDTCIIKPLDLTQGICNQAMLGNFTSLAIGHQEQQTVKNGIMCLEKDKITCLLWLSFLWSIHFHGQDLTHKKWVCKHQCQDME